MTSGMPGLWTIGHSNHPIGRLVDLLRRHGIQALADVRTMPASRFNPQFNRAPFAQALSDAGIAYLFLGAELGGKRADRPDFAAAMRDPPFQAGLARLRAECAQRPTAIACAERDPLDCHRFHLVCRALRAEALPITHILADGAAETQGATEARLLERAGRPDLPLLAAIDQGDAMTEAYDAQWRRMTGAARR